MPYATGCAVRESEVQMGGVVEKCKPVGVCGVGPLGLLRVVTSEGTTLQSGAERDESGVKDGGERRQGVSWRGAVRRWRRRRRTSTQA